MVCTFGIIIITCKCKTFAYRHGFNMNNNFCKKSRDALQCVSTSTISNNLKIFIDGP